MIRRGVLPGIAALVVALLMIQPDWIARSLSDRVTYSIATDQQVVALTVDDGPDSATTPAILDVLSEHQARATFFLISERVTGNEHLVRRMVEEGHELANHMTREEPTILLGNAGFAKELRAADSVLSVFAEAHWLRPGSGWLSEDMLSTAESQGYKVALGSVYPFDATIPSSWFASEFILWRVRPGAVIVLHDHRGRGERTATTLDRVLPELAARGFKVVTLSELVALED
jgi:peptidoglycan/xylan/chitin deacetylase (PgdA/CDA1 family)